jgi:hypothetical protein
LRIGLLVERRSPWSLENVERLMSEEGASPLEATRKSMDEILVLVGIALVLSAAVFIKWRSSASTRSDLPAVLDPPSSRRCCCRL